MDLGRSGQSSGQVVSIMVGGRGSRMGLGKDAAAAAVEEDEALELPEDVEPLRGLCMPSHGPSRSEAGKPEYGENLNDLYPPSRFTYTQNYMR